MVKNQHTVLYLSIGMGIIIKFLAVPILRTTKIDYFVILPLTPHTLANRQTCQKEKCMINRL